MLVAAGVLVAGCAGQEVSGSAQPTGDIDPGNVAGLPVTDGPSGLKPGVSTANLTVQNGDGGAMDKLAVDSLTLGMLREMGIGTDSFTMRRSHTGGIKVLPISHHG